MSDGFRILDDTANRDTELPDQSPETTMKVMDDTGGASDRMSEKSFNTYRDRYQKVINEHGGSYDPNSVKDVGSRALKQMKRDRGDAPLRPMGVEDQAGLDEIQSRMSSISKEFSELDLTNVLRSEGLGAFQSALALTRSADTAFEMTIGKIPDKESKVRYYSALLNVPEQTVRDNFQTVEEKVLYMDQKSLMENSTNLLKYASEPRNMNVIKDSLKGLAHIESLLVSRHGSYVSKAGTSATGMFTDMSSGVKQGVAGVHAAAADVMEGIAWIAGGGDADANAVSKAMKSMSNTYNKLENTLLKDARTAQEQTVRLTDEVSGFERFTVDVTSGVAQMGAFIGAGMVNPGMAMFMMGAMEGGHVYGDLRDHGVSSSRALLPAFGVGVINSYLEKMQINNAMKAIGMKKGRGALRNVLQGGFENFLQEASQNVVSEAGLVMGESGITDAAHFETVDRMKEALDQGAYEGMVAFGTIIVLGTPSLYKGTMRYRGSLLGRGRFREA